MNIFNGIFKGTKACMSKLYKNDENILNTDAVDILSWKKKSIYNDFVSWHA